MGQRPKSFEIWCQEKGKEHLLQEWNTKRLFPTEINYNSPRPVRWKCREGHEWIGPVVARSLFGRECPFCNEGTETLRIGTKYGCLTIIGDYSVYDEKVAKWKIAELKAEREDFLRGKRKPNSNIDSVDYFDKQIENYRNQKRYQCQCKCGMIYFMDEFQFLKKKHRYCPGKEGDNYGRLRQSTENLECGLKRRQKELLSASYKRIYDPSYEIDFTHTFHESLEVLECIDEQYEKLTSWHDKRKKGGGTYTVYKLYRCRCYLCGKEKNIDSSMFHISPPADYGYNAYNGYYSEAYCGCHKISSFQWIVNKILIENSVPYRVEVTFPNLYGVGNTILLRYDFSILNSDGTIKCLIECQGEQHYKPIEEFGGERQFEIQKKNDELKRKYAADNGITLLEIPYRHKKFENVEKFLRSNDII